MDLKIFFIAYYVIFVICYAIKRVESSNNFVGKCVGIIMFTIFFPFVFPFDLAMIVNKINKEL